VREPLFSLPLHLVPGRSDAAHIREQFAVIHDALRGTGGSESRLALPAAGALLQALLLQLGRGRVKRPEAHRGRAQASLDKASEWLDSHFQEQVNIRTLAAASGLSRNFFAHRFREKLGMTVNRYLLRRRIELAKYLLLSTDRTIKEIAFECCIPDPHYFNKQFRRICGISPSSFRLQNGK
jgi:AraC-like DNA-binding protein